MKYFKQEKDYTCGCACVRMAISHFNQNIPSELELEKILKTLSNKGTHPNIIAEYFKNEGYNVVKENNSSLDKVRFYYKEGYVVMLAISVDVPHFTVYNGDNGNHIFFFDPFFGEISKLISKFVSDKTIYPFYRWRVVSNEFKKYYSEANFDDEESYNYFIAIKK
ncbi:MAG: cysteine peptidase family C39 domain-containing protein [Candidatus Nanoarchaeia archaeon]|nr:cysteine peptidase family C39 domain-containing protein [Candidatus Nanoarchaeia archaeon]